MSLLKSFVEFNNKKIGIIGLGKLGLSLIHKFLLAEYNVFCWLRNEKERKLIYDNIVVQHPHNFRRCNYYPSSTFLQKKAKSNSLEIKSKLLDDEIKEFTKFINDCDIIFICYNHGNAYNAFGKPQKGNGGKLIPGKTLEEVLKDEELVGKYGEEFLKKAYEFYAGLINMNLDQRVCKYLPFNLDAAVQYGNLLKEAERHSSYNKHKLDVFVQTNPTEEIAYAIANERENFDDVYSIGLLMDCLRLENYISLSGTVSELISNLTENKQNDKISLKLEQFYTKPIKSHMYGYHGKDLVIDFSTLQIGNEYFDEFIRESEDEKKHDLKNKIIENIIKWAYDHLPLPDPEYGSSIVYKLFHIMYSNSQTDYINLGLYTPGVIKDSKNITHKLEVFLNRPAIKNPDETQCPGTFVPLQKKFDDLPEDLRNDLINIINKENTLLDYCQKMKYFKRKTYDEVLTAKKSKLQKHTPSNTEEILAIKKMVSQLAQNLPISSSEEKFSIPNDLDNFIFIKASKENKFYLIDVSTKKYYFLLNTPKNQSSLFSRTVRYENFLVSVDVGIENQDISFYYQTIPKSTNLKKDESSLSELVKYQFKDDIDKIKKIKIEDIVFSAGKAFFLARIDNDDIKFGAFDLESKKGCFIKNLNAAEISYMNAFRNTLVIGNVNLKPKKFTIINLEKINFSKGEILEYKEEHIDETSKLIVHPNRIIKLTKDFFIDQNTEMESVVADENYLYVFANRKNQHSLDIYAFADKSYKFISLSYQFDSIHLLKKYICLLDKEKKYIHILDKNYNFCGTGTFSEPIEIIHCCDK